MWFQSAGYTPSWVKVKYGAWYLDPKTWKSRAADEPLQDPKEIDDNQMSETKQKSKDLVNYSKFVMLVIMVAVVNVSLPNYIWKKLQEKC